MPVFATAAVCRLFRASWLGLFAACAVAFSPPAAQASQCFAFVETAPPGLTVTPVVYQPAGQARTGPRLANDVPTVAIEFVGHATFQLTTPAGIVAATDYTGRNGSAGVPNVVTMNRAHSTHYTDNPDPRIDHVLRGWNPLGGEAKHDLEVGDLRVRNVATDIRSWTSAAVDKHGNSIFIFEVADLCIGHLGHLHHRLSDADLALIGRLDVVMAPVDGSWTLDIPNMIATLKDLRASLVIPMHFFGARSLSSFLAGMSDDFQIRRAQDRTIRVSLASLPRQPTVLVPYGY
jgi:L-ascorbate metabolism protein UlaG (beta-lactamase superfamily)